MAKQTIVFDFDGVIHSYTSGWQGMTTISDPPTAGVPELIEKLRSNGYQVIVVSTRCADPAGFIAVSDWLDSHAIEVDAVLATKPPALVYIDDRAYRFTGPMLDNDVEQMYNDIVNFVPWMNKEY